MLLRSHRANLLFGIIIILNMVMISSCDPDRAEEVKNNISLGADSVAYDNTGQFLTITSDGEWTISLSSPLGNHEEWFSINPLSGSGSKSNIVLSYSKNEEDFSREVLITVDFGKEKLEKRFVQGEAPSSGGGGGGGSSELKSDIINKWMELPSVTIGGKVAYISHLTTVSGKSVRNYSMLFDGVNRIALWVAYPLCSTYLGSQSRSNAWDYDPKIPTSMQPTLFKGFSGYDRGHQLPSASRTASYSMNAATFYFSNMTPQNSSLNQGIWAKLETKVRGYTSSCDTLYVVTGPVITTTESPTISYVKDNNGNNVAIPKGYFKVLLKYKKSSNSYSSIGFWFDNKSYGYGDPTAANAQTVAWVEKKTGLTFFNNLPDDKKTAIKNEFNPSAWGL